MSKVKIRDVRAIATAPGGTNLLVVKVETTEPGLYGLGCATFAYRIKAVASIIEDYFQPLLVGRGVEEIEDLWHLMKVNAYWRNGPVINNAISGVDMALWDIKGKMANMPVYQLLGGKTRAGVRIYAHANATDLDDLGEKVQALKDKGLQVVRVQCGGRTFASYGGSKPDARSPRNVPDGLYVDPVQYRKGVIKMFQFLQDNFGDELEFCHDTHERIPPTEAVRLAKSLEPFNLFFLEDLLSPENGDWFSVIRQQTTVPLAQGELFNNPKEFDFLLRERLIDYIRIHMSQVGGFTPSRKIAILAEHYGVRTAWHGPSDLSPVGHAANVHLSIASHNFGIQEWTFPRGALCEVFSGYPEYENGYVYPNEKPGFGVDIDEELAKKYPCNDKVTTWTQCRLIDGGIQYP